MKKSGKLLTALLLLLALSLCMFAACNGKGKTEAKVTLKTPRVTEYRVGDNVDLYDFIEYDESQEYAFKVAKNGSEAEPKEVKGRTYYAAESGKYSAEITAKSGEKSDSETVEFNVFEAVPFVRVLKSEFDVNYMRSVPMDWLIGQSAPYIKGNDYESYCDYVFYYEYADATGEKIELEEATADGFFDGNDRIKFIKEGIYVFHLIVENSGGLCDGSFTVNVYEDFSAVPDIAGGVIEYDEQTKTATWNKVENATDYRIKIDRKEAIVSASAENTYSLDITPYLTSEFQHFDLVVTARDDKAQAFGKMTKEIIVSPEKYGKLVLSSGTKMNADTGVATLAGRYANSLGWMGIRDSMSNTYAAWSGNYGVGTFVEFEFTGNNMPQLCFFADKINGDITQGYDANRNKGILLLGGLYGQAFSNVYQTFWGDKLTVWGPNRGYMHCNSVIWTHYKTVTEDYPLFTQDGLTRAGDVTYKLVAGTYADGGTIMANLQLYNKSNGKLLHNAHISTGVKTTELSGGNIIAFSTVKGEDKPTEFTVLGKPYAGEPKYTLEEKDGVYAYNATFNSDDTVTIQSRQLGGAAFMDNVNPVNLGYISIDGDYGAGTYVDFTFKGNNMPYIVLFADRVNEGRNVLKGGKLTDTLGSKGLLLFNGMVTSRTSAEGSLASNEGSLLGSLLVYGPNRMPNYTNPNNTPRPSIDGGKWLTAISGYPTSGTGYPMFSQRGLDNAGADKEYKLTVGTFRNGDSLWIDVSIYDGATDEVIHSVQRDLGLTTEQIEYLGTGSIIAMANMKGTKDLYSTTFGYSKPYTKETILMNSGATFNRDGSVTLAGKLTEGTNGGGNNKEQNYIAFKGNYGVGTYVDFTFKGNNMPELVFFADIVNGNFTNTTRTASGKDIPAGKGLLILNGIQHTLNNDNRLMSGNMIQVWGLDRMSTNAEGGTAGTNGLLMQLQNVVLNGDIMRNVLPFTQSELRKDDNTNVEYKYVAGTYANNGTIWIDLKLYVVGNSTPISEINEDTGISVSSIEADMCNIIAYTAFKGAGNDTTFTYSDPYKNESTIISNGATFNGNTVTLVGKKTSGAAVNDYNKLQSYMGFKGDYGVGTYIDFTFTGNNMPQLVFFADTINGNFTSNTSTASVKPIQKGKGMSILNGVYHYNDNRFMSASNLQVWGLDRMSAIPESASATGRLLNLSGSAVTVFTQNGLKSTPDTKYKYIAGTYEDNGNVWVYLRLYTIGADDKETLVGLVNENTGIAVSDITSDMCNIIAYPTFKGAGNDTTFTYSAPYSSAEKPDIVLSGATFNRDGSVTMNSRQLGAASTISNVRNVTDLAYVSLEGDYGVGTYVDFYFKGNNMPNVVLFSESAYTNANANNLTDTGGKGLLFHNGMALSRTSAEGSLTATDGVRLASLYVYGPERIKNSTDNGDTIGYADYPNGRLVSFLQADYPLLTQIGLDNAGADKSYKYTVGTHMKGAELWLFIGLYNGETGEKIYEIDCNSTLTPEQIAQLGTGSIVAMANMKGTSSTYKTTFSFSQPYTKTAA